MTIDTLRASIATLLAALEHSATRLQTNLLT